MTEMTYAFDLSILARSGADEGDLWLGSVVQLWWSGINLRWWWIVNGDLVEVERIRHLIEHFGLVVVAARRPILRYILNLIKKHSKTVI